MPIPQEYMNFGLITAVIYIALTVRAIDKKTSILKDLVNELYQETHQERVRRQEAEDKVRFGR